MKISHINISKNNQIPVYIFGAEPKILLMAGVHGNEKTGVVILKKIIKQLRDGNTPYPVVIIPCVNLPAYQANSRVNPKDKVDLNRIFPVVEVKNQSYKIAKAIQDYAEKFTTVVDIHVFVGHHSLMCGVDLNVTKSKTNEKIKKIMSQIGLEAICRIDHSNEPKKDGSLCAYLQHKNILAFGIELSSLEVLTKIDSKNITKHLIALIKGLRKLNKFRKIESYKRLQVFSKHEGLFLPKKVPGFEIKKNDIVATLTEKNKKTLTISSPFDGKLISISYKKPVKKDDKIFVIGRKIKS